MHSTEGWKEVSFPIWMVWNIHLISVASALVQRPSDLDHVLHYWLSSMGWTCNAPWAPSFLTVGNPRLTNSAGTEDRSPSAILTLPRCSVSAFWSEDTEWIMSKLHSIWGPAPKWTNNSLIIHKELKQAKWMPYWLSQKCTQKQPVPIKITLASIQSWSLEPSKSTGHSSLSVFLHWSPTHSREFSHFSL